MPVNALSTHPAVIAEPIWVIVITALRSYICISDDAFRVTLSSILACNAKLSSVIVHDACYSKTRSTVLLSYARRLALVVTAYLTPGAIAVQAAGGDAGVRAGRTGMAVRV